VNAFQPDKQNMLDGKEGKAGQRAMELLVRYAEGLGADSFVGTINDTSIPGSIPNVNIFTPFSVFVASGVGIVSKGKTTVRIKNQEGVSYARQEPTDEPAPGRRSIARRSSDRVANIHY
jgi:hypothetical protein